MRKDVFLCLIILLSGMSLYAQTSYKIDASKSNIEFKIKNSGINVDGSLSGLSGKIIFSPSVPEKSSFQIQLLANTINTGIAARDSHLKKEEYFNVSTYPTIQFVSQEIKRSGNNFWVKGMLTIKGKSKEVEFLFTFQEYQNSAVFAGSIEINRLDYGVGSSSWVLSDVAKVTMNVMVTK